MQKHITDFDIQALADDELDAQEAERVRDFIERNHWAKERYEQLLDQKKVLKQWWSENKEH